MSKFTQLPGHPKAIGMYLQGPLQYNIDLPVKGVDVIPIFFGFVTHDEMDARVDVLQAAFTADQEASQINPVKWVNVGYVEDATGLTFYHQYQYPEPQFDPQQWSNWPTEPPVYTDA